MDDSKKLLEELVKYHRSTQSNSSTPSTENHAQSELTTPEILAKRYNYKELLGQGATGKTFLAYDKLTGKQVAVKALKVKSDLKIHELFEREASVMKSIDVPGIPKYYDFIASFQNGEDEAYIVQEFIRGSSLQTLIDDLNSYSVTSDGPLIDEKEIWNFISQLAAILNALQTTYNPPIIHRDIKPSNILIHENNYYLIDFGAVANPQRKTLNSTIAGTQGFMAPEQLIGDCTIQSDYYALGATVLYMVTGVAPYDIPIDGFKLLYAPLLDKKSISPKLRHLIDKLLQPSPSDRPKNIEALLALIDAKMPKTDDAVINAIKKSEFFEKESAPIKKWADRQNATVLSLAAPWVHLANFLRYLPNTIASCFILLYLITPLFLAIPVGVTYAILYNFSVPSSLCVVITFFLTLFSFAYYAYYTKREEFYFFKCAQVGGRIHHIIHGQDGTTISATVRSVLITNYIVCHCTYECDHVSFAATIGLEKQTFIALLRKERDFEKILHNLSEKQFADQFIQGKQIRFIINPTSPSKYAIDQEQSSKLFERIASYAQILQ